MSHAATCHMPPRVTCRHVSHAATCHVPQSWFNEHYSPVYPAVTVFVVSWCTAMSITELFKVRTRTQTQTRTRTQT